MALANHVRMIVDRVAHMAQNTMYAPPAVNIEE